ncbi:MAG: fibronectin type III domain-containing protein, partial [Verrucomicrobiae bacterium]|nr:fibronectin type III domain-containing protein [Verrucomicrobiae bacterium]
RGIRTEAIPGTPGNFTASDGAFRDRVRLRWDVAPGAIRYRVFRGDTPNLARAFPIVVIKDGSVNAYDDEAIRPGTTHYYFIVAEGMGGRGPWSEEEEGHAAMAGDSLDLPESAPYETVSGEVVDLNETEIVSRFSGVLRDTDDPGLIMGDVPNLLVRTVGDRTILSGLFRIGYHQFRVRGRFEEDGSFLTTLIPFRGAEPTVVSLQLIKTDEDEILLSGTLEGEISAVLDTSAIPWHPRRHPWEEPGRYTFLMPDEEGGETACGIALAGINRAGVARWLGYTPEGARFSAVSRIGQDRQLPLFARYRLPQRRFGNLAGTLEFRELEGISDLDGSVVLRVRDEPESENQRAFLGSRFEGESLVGRVWVSFSGTEGMENLDATWDERGRIGLVGNDRRLRLSVNHRSGMVAGVWNDRIEGKFIRMKAVVFPRQNLAVGWYRETGHSETSLFAVEPD